MATRKDVRMSGIPTLLFLLVLLATFISGTSAATTCVGSIQTISCPASAFLGNIVGKNGDYCCYANVGVRTPFCCDFQSFVENSTGLTIGAIIGIVIGALVAVVLLFVLLCCCCGCCCFG